MSEYFRLYVGIFPTMWEFFRQCGNFPTMSHFQRGFFPPCRNFSQFPSYMPGKIPSFLMEGLPGLSDAKNAVGDSKNIPLTAEGIIRHM
jgi:hypothetical protein